MDQGEDSVRRQREPLVHLEGRGIRILDTELGIIDSSDRIADAKSTPLSLKIAFDRGFGISQRLSLDCGTQFFLNMVHFLWSNIVKLLSDKWDSSEPSLCFGCELKLHLKNRAFEFNGGPRESARSR